MNNRREFIKHSINGMLGCCAFAECPALFGRSADEEAEPEAEKYVAAVSQDITYCAYRCSKDCPWLTASLSGNTEKLNELAKAWSEHHEGRTIPEDQRFCFGCKPVNDKPEGYIVAICTVKPCAMEKGFASCIECSDLATCDKDLWKRYPRHREYVLGLQKAE
jgi:hypothetical protein